MGEANEVGLAHEPVDRADLDSRGEGLELTDKVGKPVPLGDMDAEGDWLPDPLCEGERELRRFGDMVSSNVPAEDGEGDREVTMLPLGRGLLDVEREAFAEGEREGLGDTVKVPLLEALILGERLTVAVGKGELEEDTVALLDRDRSELFDVEELAVAEGSVVADLTPEGEPLVEPVDTTDTEADTDWVVVGEGEGAPEPVAFEYVGFGVPVASTDVVRPGVEVPVVKGETVAKEAVGAPETEGMGDNDAEWVVVVDREAVVEDMGEILPPSPGLAVGAMEKVAPMVAAPDEDPERVPAFERVRALDTEELREELGDTKGEEEKRGEREADRVPVLTPLWLPLPLPIPL